MPTESNIWFITGASSGCGRAFAKIAAQRGELVIATARKLESIKDLESDSIKILQLDVTKPPSDLAEQAKALFGRAPSVLFSNAGYGTVGPVEEVTQEEWQASFDTNFFGLLAVQRLLLLGIRSYRERGWILNNTSMAAYWDSDTFSCYQATKHALANVNGCLAQELKHIGTHVISLEIGFAETGFFVDNKATGRKAGCVYSKGQSEGDAYATIKKAKADFFSGVGNSRAPFDPEKIAHRVIDIVRDEGAAKGRKHPLELPLGYEAFKLQRDNLVRKLQEMQEWEDFGSDVKFDDM